MIPKECRRLAEVDFPIAVVSKHAAREKFVRHGHPSTLHLWWARRPLAACRAMLLGLLLPDPADEACPEEFKTQARELLAGVQRGLGTTDLDLRQALLRFIGEFSNWDLAGNETYVAVARGLVRAPHGEEAPLVVDPFAGGGSIPFEALRLGCETFASDLNPVACLILKVLLEEIPRHGPALAEELRKAGREVGEAAAKELAELYPQDPDGASPIAYLWARTVLCEAPSCGCEIPLARSFWLSKKAHRRRALRFTVVRSGGEAPRVEFEVFEPERDDEVPRRTVSRAKATCPACHVVLPPERVRAQLAAQRGGADTVFDKDGRRIGGARLLAVVALREEESGRQYRLPAAADYAAVRKAQQRLRAVAARPLASGLSSVPDEPTPTGGGKGAGRAFSVQRYGMLRWGDLFTARQKLALTGFSSVCVSVSTSGNATARLRMCLALALSRLADKTASLVFWHDSREFVDHVFARQALSMCWSWAEAQPFSGFGWDGAVEWIATVCERDSLGAAGPARAQIQQGDAAEHPLPEGSTAVWFTDPP